MSAEAENWILTVAGWLTASPDGTPTAEQAEFVKSQLMHANPIELESLLGILDNQLDGQELSATRVKVMLQLVVARIGQLARSEEQLEVAWVDPSTLRSVYDKLIANNNQEAAAHVIQMLATQTDEESIHELSQILAQSPPDSWREVGLGLSPLWNSSPSHLQRFFESLANEFLQPSTLAVLLDLANHGVRSGQLVEHPWRSQVNRLVELLTQVAKRLSELEVDPSRFGENVEQIQQTLGDSTALTVSLCDALGLIGDPDATECLMDVLQLSHRRIQTEAAGALARLGNERGRQRIVELASDGAARMRAVSYAEELEFLDEIPEAQRSSEALAESELAAWLAAPQQYGFAPHQMELVDSRTQFWPSFDEPQSCYLFRFTYGLTEGRLSNVGIAGPLTCSFATDLANLPVDDIYAAFAGWQAEHDEIFEVPASELNMSQRRECDRLEQAIGDMGFEVNQTLAFTWFFGEMALLAEVTQDGKKMVAVADGQELLCYPISDSPSSMTPEVALCIYRGRKLLRTFND